MSRLHRIRDMLDDSETLRQRIRDLEENLDGIKWVDDERTVRKAIHTADQAAGTVVNWLRSQLAKEENR